MLQAVRFQGAVLPGVRFGEDSPKPGANTPVNTPVSPPADSFKATHACKNAKRAGGGLKGHVLAYLAAVATTLGIGAPVVNNLNQGIHQNNTAITQGMNGLNGQLNGINNQLNGLKGTLGQMDVAGMVEQVAPNNVMVKGANGLGSGSWVRDTKGNLYILTNHHVVDGNSIYPYSDIPPTFKIRMYNGSDTSSATEVEAQVVKLPNGKFAMSDQSDAHDMALLAVTTPNFHLPANVKTIQLRDLQKEPLKVGEQVVVIGTPLGLTDNVTVGHISHIDRKIGLEPANIFIGTDAPINPGNSGGALYDMQGRFIGINTAGVRGANNLGFSIRTDVIKDVLSSWGVELQQ
ncbi:MAG: trypsin-like peptidase domain-containing protein [Cyanobacteria bacterium]|nr:trypsin-like peptidase domain-containing protein [Cyanobacteriota bacterium]